MYLPCCPRERVPCCALSTRCRRMCAQHGKDEFQGAIGIRAKLSVDKCPLERSI